MILRWYYKLIRYHLKLPKKHLSSKWVLKEWATDRQKGKATMANADGTHYVFYTPFFVKNKYQWLYKPLGGCIYCFSTWVFIVIFSICYYMNGETWDYKVEYSKIIRESRKNEPKPPEKEVKKIQNCERLLWRKYRNAVWKITEKQNLKKLPDFEKRGAHNYHLDHKVSIWYGYKNKLDPKLIGSIDNLEFIPWKENFKKSIKCNFKKAKCLQTIIFV